MDGSAYEEKSSFKMLGLTFSSKLDWRSFIISIAKTSSKKIGASKFVLLIFFLLRLLCISINLPYANVWNTVFISGLVPLIATLASYKNKYLRAVGPSLAASLEPLAHRWNVASLVFSIGITLVDVLQNWSNWFFLSLFLGATRMSTSTLSFLIQLDSGILCYRMLSFDL